MVKESQKDGLTGKRILFVIADNFTFRIRQYKEAMSLHDAGAEVIFLCMGTGESQIWKDAPFQIITKPKFLPKPHYSKSSIWALRVGLNLTINLLLRKFDEIKEKRNIPKFIKAGVQINPDVVHAVDLGSLALSNQIAKATRAKLVYDSCDYWPGFLQNPLWDKARKLAKQLEIDERDNIKFADVVLVTGKTMRKKLNQYYNIDNCEVIYNSIDIKKSEIRTSGISNPIKFVYHGAIIPDRNVDTLIKIFSKLPNNVTLDIYGEFISCDRADFEHLIKFFGLDHKVNIHGKFNFNEMLEFLPTYDIGIYLAQKTDGNFDITVPTKLFDCVCAGLAVVMPKFLSITEELEDVCCGVTVDTCDENAVLETINSLIKDPDRIIKYKKASRLAEPVYNWQSQGARLIDIYRSLLS